MYGEPSGFWSKLKSDEAGRVLAWHPLVDHCADVAACCEALLVHTLLRQRLAATARLGDLSPIQVARLCFLAALHDMGKCNIGFQNKALARPLWTAGHLREVVLLFGDAGYEATDRLSAALPLAELRAWCEPGTESALELLLAALSHHGKPIAIAGGHHDPRNWQPARGLDPFEGIRTLAAQARQWLPAAFEPGEPLPAAIAFQHAWSGLVTLADWLGSDADRFFPFREDGDGDRMPFAREQARKALRAIGLDAQAARASLGAAAPGFDSFCDFSPHPAQEAVRGLPLPASGSLAILEAETGSGKTEAALARYLQLFHAGRVDALYFALPTRSAASQIHGRVYEAVRRAFPKEEDRPPVVLAVPGYLQFDYVTGRRHTEDGARLPGFEVLWNDDPADRNRYRGWAAEHPKRYLAGAVVVGTVDQVLLSSLTVSHAHMRATALSRSLLVVDEVHASDAYMTRLLEEVLACHLGSGGHALLMSATLGGATRARLLARAGSREPLPSLAEARCTPYPLISRASAAGASEPIAPPASGAAKAVRVELLGCQEDADEIARLALAAARAGARVLVLRNTVKGCLATQLALEIGAAGEGLDELLFRCNGLPAPHHSRFAREDRLELDRAIEASFGKGSARAVVAATTQTVEQSLDIDADLLVTDLCPMDILLQRIGRLHRHRDRSRPPGFEHPEVVVLAPPERDLTPRIRRGGEATGGHGLGTVYSDLRVLEATWRALERQRELTVPAMNRALVEEVTHPDALAVLLESLPAEWRDHQNHVLGSLSHQRQHARLNLLDRSKPFGEAEFPRRELERRIGTRLGEEDRLAAFAEPFRSPFGKTVNTLTLPAYLTRAVPAGVSPQVERLDDERLVFAFGDRRFIYDRLGLRPVEEKEPEE